MLLVNDVLPPDPSCLSTVDVFVLLTRAILRGLFVSPKVDLMYGKGFDLHGELLDLGCDVGLLSKSGAW